MGLIKSIKSKFGFKSNPLIDTSEKLAQAVGVGYETITGQQITTTRAMQLTTVFGCVRVLSESIGMLPCKLYKEEGRNKITATSHKLYDLLYTAPNSYMTAQEHWELLTACLCLRGNYYAYKVKGLGNEVIELLPINPDRVKPKLNDDWTVEYQVTFKTGLQTLTQDEIWHVRLFTLDGLHGLFEDRRLAVFLRMIAVGGQSPAYFLNLAKQQGYPNAFITEFRAPRWGKTYFGKAHFGTWAAQFMWVLHTGEKRRTKRRFGAAVFGNKFGESPGSALECVIKRYAPAHTLVTFDYGD